MVGIIICEVSAIMCDIDIINVRFYLLEVRYPHEYCRTTSYGEDVLLALLIQEFDQRVRVFILRACHQCRTDGRASVRMA